MVAVKAKAKRGRQNSAGYRRGKRRKVEPDTPEPVKVPKKKGRGGKVITLSRFNPQVYLERMALDPSDNNYLAPSSVQKTTRNYLIYYATHSLQMSRFDLARLFEVEPQTIANILHQTQGELIDVPAEVAVERMSLDILDRMDSLSREAAMHGKPYDAWKIRKEAVELLQTLGVTFKKPEEHIVEEWHFDNLSPVPEEEDEGKSNGNGNGNGHSKHKGK